MTSVTDDTTPPATTGGGQVELAIVGMTCASCAARIEKRLNRLPGVTATVNYATEQAQIRFPAGTDPQDLVEQVEAAGYTAKLPDPSSIQAGGQAVVEDDPTRPLRDRLLVAVVLSVPVIILAMVPAWQFTYWQWLSLTLAAPVVVYGGWPFHKAAWANLRHGAATMDTLVSVGTIAALGWSLWALFFGTAGVPGMTHPFNLAVSRGDGAGNI
jgi:P-type Cu+ transporter